MVSCTYPDTAEMVRNKRNSGGKSTMSIGSVTAFRDVFVVILRSAAASLKRTIISSRAAATSDDAMSPK